MKRTLLVVSLLCFATFSFAQKKAVKEAKSSMRNNIPEARAYIKGALENEETKNDPETWKIAGDIEYKLFEKEKEKEMLQEFENAKANEAAMYEGLYNMYELYLKADTLGQVPDKKDRVRNKVRKDIVSNFTNSHPLFMNAGVYHSTKGAETQNKAEHLKASIFFERYWVLPEHEMFKEEKDPFPFLVDDSTFLVLKYYASISALQAENFGRAARLINMLHETPYIPNDAFQEIDTYELLASAYIQMGDTVSYNEMLRIGSDKFPSSDFFVPNLINLYIAEDKMGEAIEYLDLAIANNPGNRCDFISVKATLYADMKQYEEAEEAYKTAIDNLDDCYRAQKGLGVLYILQAQEIRDIATNMTNRKEQAAKDLEAEEYYKLALPLLEQTRANLENKGAATHELKEIYRTLQNVYYHMNMDEKLEEIDRLLEE